MRVLKEYFIHPLIEQTPLDDQLEKVILVDPLLGINKDQFFQLLKEVGKEKEPLILILSPIDPDLLQGVIFVNLRIGLFDRELEPLVSMAKNVYFHRELKKEHTSKSVESMQEALKRCLKKAQNKINEAKDFSTQLRSFFDGHLTQNIFETLKEQLQRFEEDVEKFPKKKEKEDSLCLIESYYGAFTSKGPRYFSYPLTTDVKKWLIIKGHAEKDISKLLSYVKKWADEQKLPNKVDRCPLHSDEIDRLMLPTLQVGLIDGNSYHPFEPIFPNDQVIDLDEYLAFDDVFYYFAPEIRELQAFYKQRMRQATLFLQEAANDLWAFIQLYEPIQSNQWLQLIIEEIG